MYNLAEGVRCVYLRPSVRCCWTPGDDCRSVGSRIRIKPQVGVRSSATRRSVTQQKTAKCEKIIFFSQNSQNCGVAINKPSRPLLVFPVRGFIARRSARQQFTNNGHGLPVTPSARRPKSRSFSAAPILHPKSDRLRRIPRLFSATRWGRYETYGPGFTVRSRKPVGRVAGWAARGDVALRFSENRERRRFDVECRVHVLPFSVGVLQETHAKHTGTYQYFEVQPRSSNIRSCIQPAGFQCFWHRQYRGTGTILRVYSDF